MVEHTANVIAGDDIQRAAGVCSRHQVDSISQAVLGMVVQFVDLEPFFAVLQLPRQLLMYVKRKT